jgi:FkbM family methyltransferase
MRIINPLLLGLWNFLAKALEKFGKLVVKLFSFRSNRVRFSQWNNLWYVSFGNVNWYFARFQRSHRYKEGLERILKKVWDSYGLSNISLPGDKIYVIDVGCNVGEFGKLIQNNYKESEIICIDAEAFELKCAQLNLGEHNKHPQRHKTIFVNALLWKSNELIEFFSVPETADSSAIKPRENAPSTFMPATTLDKIYSDLGSPFSIIDILKLDVEGAEPEVFLGAEKLLKKVRYIATDLGPERGLSQERTFSEVDAFLRKNDFELVFTSPKKRETYIYRNTLLQ